MMPITPLAPPEKPVAAISAMLVARPTAAPVMVTTILILYLV